MEWDDAWTGVSRRPARNPARHLHGGAAAGGRSCFSELPRSDGDHAADPQAGAMRDLVANLMQLHEVNRRSASA